MRWGLIPSWAKDSAGAASIINARAETAATKPAFRDALKSRRCLIPADDFYEWLRTGKTKQPYCFEVNEGELFAFAGLWERPELTVDQNLFDPNHDHKCRDLSRPRPDASDSRSKCLRLVARPRNDECEPGVPKLLKPYDAQLMRCYRVSTRINHVANGDEKCSVPVELAELRLDCSRKVTNAYRR